jgi:hypothetical protein
MYSDGIEELLEVHARETDVPTPAEINASDPLGQAVLHPRPQRILGFELRSFLALPLGLDRFVMGLWPDRELAAPLWHGCTLGGPGTHGGAGRGVPHSPRFRKRTPAFSNPKGLT